MNRLEYFAERFERSLYDVFVRALWEGATEAELRKLALHQLYRAMSSMEEVGIRNEEARHG